MISVFTYVVVKRKNHCLHVWIRRGIFHKRFPVTLYWWPLLFSSSERDKRAVKDRA